MRTPTTEATGKAQGSVGPDRAGINPLIPKLLALAGVTMIVCLVACEFILRQWFPIGGIFMQRDPRYLFKYIPNARFQYVPAGMVWDAKERPRGPRLLLTINSQGRRGETISDNNKNRIMVYGDSFIAAVGTPLKQNFVYGLEHLLNAKLSRPLQVINAGVEGYGADQECLVMEEEIDTIKPKLIIFSIFPNNEFGNLMRNKLFKLDDRNQLVANHPGALRLNDAQRSLFDETPPQSPVQVVRMAKIALNALRSSEFARDARSVLHWRRTPVAQPQPRKKTPRPSNTDRLRSALLERQQEYRSYILEGDNNVYNLFFDGPDADVSFAPRSASSQYKRLLLERLMVRIQSIASSRSVPLIFLIIPTFENVVDDPIVDEKIFSEYRRSELTDIIERIALEHHFLYVNLFEQFRKHRAEELYYADTHWNPAGQALAAAVMSDYLARNNLLAVF